MRSLPRGVYQQRRRLADGTEVVHYRWRATGKRIEGEPGTPEFEASLARARLPVASDPAGSWAALVREYRMSPAYRDMGSAARRAYDRALERVRRWEARPVGEIRRPDVLAIRDAIALTRPQAANQFAMVIGRILAFAVDREYREANPLMKLGRLKGGTHATWSDAQVRYALDRFAEPYRRAVVLALYTGQRGGDCLSMRWGQYDGSAVAVLQEKTGADLWIPAHRKLKAELDQWRAEPHGETILVNSLGRPWPKHSFAARISRVIGEHPTLKGLVFHGLRKASAARLAEAGCSTHEIAAITGHATLAMVELYTRKADQKRRAAEAIRKLEMVKD